jgi:hypothetical protein
MREMVNVDQRGSEFYVASYSKTVPGFWVMNGWLRRLESETSDEVFGTVIEEGLAASEFEVEAPGRDANPAAPLLRMVGVRSYGAYMRGTRSVGITRDGTAVTVEPTRNEGSREGFTPLPDHAEVLQAPSREELGKAVRDGFARAI